MRTRTLAPSFLTWALLQGRRNVEERPGWSLPILGTRSLANIHMNQICSIQVKSKQKQMGEGVPSLYVVKIT